MSDSFINFISLYRMNSSSPKMLNIDTSKSFTNYVTVNNPVASKNFQLTPKAYKKIQQLHLKSKNITRYNSQQELKYFSKQKSLTQQFDGNIQIQDQIYQNSSSFLQRKSHMQCQKTENQLKRIENRRKSNLVSTQFKPAFLKNFNNQSKGPTNYLKETSSTNTTDNIANNITAKSQKTIPSFLKADRHDKKKFSIFKIPQKLETNMENFRIIKQLGQGKFGSVFLAIQKFSGMIVALKMMEKKKVIEENFLTQFIRQLKIQTYLDHPNIAKVYGFFHDANYFYTIMELGQGGQLYDIIMNGQTLSQESTSFIIGNLLDAINYMHKNKILHRDIKPENIVLVHGNVKLCDFGWAVYKKAQLRSTFCGTPLYLSPELLNGQKYGQKVDLWAIGILAYELHLGSSPFDIKTQQDLLKIITDQIQYPQNRKVSSCFKQFIQAVLKKNPNEREPAQKLLSMKFIKKYRELQTCEELCQSSQAK